MEILDPSLDLRILLLQSFQDWERFRSRTSSCENSSAAEGKLQGRVFSNPWVQQGPQKVINSSIVMLRRRKVQLARETTRDHIYFPCQGAFVVLRRCKQRRLSEEVV